MRCERLGIIDLDKSVYLVEEEVREKLFLAEMLTMGGVRGAKL
jgi:hypothetical protein